MTINITNHIVEEKIKKLAQLKGLKYVQAVNFAVSRILEEEKNTLQPTYGSMTQWFETHVWPYVDYTVDTSKEGIEKLLGY